MNEYCHTGFSQVRVLYQQHKAETDSALVRSMEAKDASGMQGEPLPYSLYADWSVTCMIFCCFFLIFYAIRNGKKYLYQHFKGFFKQKDRASLFDDDSGYNFRYALALSASCCVLYGLFLYGYFTETAPSLLHVMPHILLLGIYIASVLLLVCIKWGAYLFVNWVFFEKEQNARWITSYFDLLGGCGLMLFPVSLLAVYFGLSAGFSCGIVLFILICGKILLFYKCIRNFFSRFHGILHLILYFCALEIGPLLFLWKGLAYINNLLILNF